MLEFAFPQAVKGSVEITVVGTAHPPTGLGEFGRDYASTWSLNTTYPVAFYIGLAGITDLSTIDSPLIVDVEPDPATYLINKTVSVPVSAGTTKDDTSLYLWYADNDHFGSDYVIGLYDVSAVDKPKLTPGRASTRGHFS